MADYEMKTDSGINFFHASSAFQKCIRRGMEHEALWFGTDLILGGYDEYVWFRMRVICSEDVGLADPTVILKIEALYSTYIAMKKKKNKHKPERLQIMHAMIILCRCKKSRLIDNKLCYYFDQRKKITPPVLPDFTFDMHTREGKKMGRGNDYFYKESAKINNDCVARVPDEYPFRDYVWNLYRHDEGKPPITKEDL